MRAVCGLDVHKDSVYLCILHDSGEIFENVYGVLTFKLEEMRRVMQSHGVTSSVHGGQAGRRTASSADSPTA